MDFFKYMHVERLNEDNDEVEGILNGDVYVYTKLDGSCCSIYLDNKNNVRAASRNRVLSIDNDNHGCCKYVSENPKFENYIRKHPNHILYGEWLVPHTIKTYRADAWNKIYIFDVVEVINANQENPVFRYLTYEEYKPLLEEFNIEYIPLIVKLHNPTPQELYDVAECKGFLQDEAHCAEGIVIKRYDFKNKYNRTVWAKFVRKIFKIKKYIKKDINTDIIEQEIVNKFATSEFIEKEYQKIVNEKDGWNNKYIPMLLGTIWHTFITENAWAIVNKYKNPTIDFKLLNKLVVDKIKEVKSNLF